MSDEIAVDVAEAAAAAVATVASNNPGQLDEFLVAAAELFGCSIGLVRIVAILLFALAVSVASELVNWFILYTDKDYLETLEALNRMTRKLDVMRESLSQNDRNNAKVKGQEEQLKAKQQDISWPTMKAQIISSVVYFGAFPIFNRLFGGIAVAQLPFEPVLIMRSFAHRGMTVFEETDCSASYLCILAGNFFRTNLTHLFAPVRLKGCHQPSSGLATVLQQVQEQAEAKNK